MNRPQAMTTFDTVARLLAEADEVSLPVVMPSSDVPATTPQLRLVTTTQGFAQLKPAWDRLTREPMQSFAWNFAWWQHMGQDDALHLYCLEQDGQLVAVAPLYRDRWLTQDRLRFLGSGNTCTDYVQLIGPPAIQSTFAGLIADDLAKRGSISVVEIEGITDGFVDDAFHVALQSSHWNYQQEIEQSWVLDLPERWDDFVASCPKSLTRKIRKALKRIDTAECSIRSTADGLPLKQANATLVELHQMRFVEKGEAGIFSDSAFTKFSSQAIADLAANGQAEILTAYAGDTPIGAHVLLHTPRGPQYYQGGSDTRQMKFEPGHLLHTYAIKRAIENGSQTYDFLRGNEPYKQFWGATAQPLWKVRHVTKTIKATAINRTFRVLRTMRNTARGLMQ